MMTKKTAESDWRTEQWAQQKAGEQADAIVRRLGLSYPIDPLAVAADEFPLLRCGGRDFENRFDGKLRYVAERRSFVLMYNTKYDEGYSAGRHHPRTRFSIGHELGHYFLEKHHSYLMHGGRSHPSINEFRSKLQIEREADAFAASLLLPTHLAAPVVNAGELSVARLEQIAGDFETSLVSTAIRAVQLSHFPCALAGIREGLVAWMFPSAALIRAQIYPQKGSLPGDAQAPWTDFEVGERDRTSREGRAGDWFRCYGGGDQDRIFVTEEYIPVPALGTLLCLLTMDENDVFPDGGDESDYEEDDD
jgi:hypothetical protein